MNKNTTAKNNIGKRFLVTSALPYANGKLHIGHIAGAYLPADICVRYFKLLGRDVVFICGSDENGVPITVSAAKEGVDPKVIIDRYHKIIKQSFAGMGINFDIYDRTSSELHTEIAKKIFLRLYEKGYVQKRHTQQLYCTSCERFLPDRYVEGVCHHCQKPGAKGDQCESCGKMIDAVKLLEPACVICKATPEIRDTDHWFFRLDSCEKELRKFIDERPHFRDNVKRFSTGLLNQGLLPRPITRDLSWGIPVPLEEAEGKVLYVWFDAPIGYLSFTRQWAKNKGEPDLWKKYWTDEDSRILHFIGKDNIVFHSIVWPAMLISHGGFHLPDDVVANEFLNISGSKTSTSRNYAVWVDEYLEAFPPDPLRYYLCAIAPEGSDSDFSWTEFKTRNNSELADTLGNFIQRNLIFTKKYFDNKVPEANNLSEPAKSMLTEIDKAKIEISNLLDQHHYRQALTRLMRFAQLGNRFLENEKPWSTRKTDIERCGMTIHIGLRIVEALSVLMTPFLPFSAEKLRNMLSLAQLQPGDWNKPLKLQAGHKLGNKTEILFHKFEDEEITPHLKKLLG